MLTGGCACGRIRYEASGQPIIFGSCYCRQCQYASGGAPSHAFLMLKSELKVMPAMPRAWRSTSEKGNQVTRYFCEQCGTPLFAESSANPAVVSIKAGSLDDPGVFKSSGSIWVSSAQPWHHVDPDLPRFDKEPPQ